MKQQLHHREVEISAWLCKTNHAFLLCFEGSGSIVMMKTVRWESDDGPVQANATDDE